MTSKEKAKELYDNFLHLLPDSGDISKQDIQQCAIRAVVEIIKSNPTSQRSDPFLGNRTYENVNYWKQVKQEIESL